MPERTYTTMDAREVALGHVLLLPYSPHTHSDMMAKAVSVAPTPPPTETRPSAERPLRRGTLRSSGLNPPGTTSCDAYPW